MKLSQLKPNPDNPRKITAESLAKLKQSIEDFPRIMEARPIIVDEHSVILGGNMRYAAIKALGIKDIPDEWVKRVEGLSEAEKKELIVKDNVSSGQWDWDVLPDFASESTLADWGVIDWPTSETDLFPVETPKATGSSKKITDDEYTNYEIILLKSNKQILLKALSKSQKETGGNRIEDAFMHIINLYYEPKQ